MCVSNRFWLFVSIAALVACARPPRDEPPVGSIRVAVTAADVASVTIAITGPGIGTAITASMTGSGGEWSGTISNVPAGSGRTVTAEGRDGLGVVIYRGSATDVTVAPGATAAVSVIMQEVTPPPPYGNTAPVIDSTFASDLTPAGGDTITVSVTAHDDDAGAVLAYEWVATAGTFTPASANARVVQWTAPAAGGGQTLTVRVTDERGLSASASFTLSVVTAGALALTISANTWPVVSAMTATPAHAPVGQPVDVSAAATDADGDPLTTAWSSDCAGTFTGTAGTATRFTPSAVPAGNRCVLTATVSDGRQGTAQGSTGIWVGLAAPPTTTLPPSGPLGLVAAQFVTTVANSVPDDGTGEGTVRVSLPSPSTPGNFILVVASQNTRTSPVAVSDNLGNTSAAGRYLTNALATAKMNATFSVQAFWLPVCDGGVQHIDVRSGAYQRLMVIAAEFSGVARVPDPFDQGFTHDVYANGDGAAFAAGPTPATLFAPELVIAVARSVPTPGLSYEAGPGYALIGASLTASDDDAFAAEFAVASTAGIQSPTFVQRLSSGGSTHHAFALTFRGE